MGSVAQNSPNPPLFTAFQTLCARSESVRRPQYEASTPGFSRLFCVRSLQEFEDRFCAWFNK